MSQDGEERIKNKLVDLTNKDFHILPDVSGKNIFYGNQVVIDYFLFPKKHLISAGFDPIWFGIEVKHFGIPGETGKMSRFIWQCITYTQSEFSVEEEVFRPVFVLGFSDFAEVNSTEKFHYQQWVGMLRLAGLAKVGTFHEIQPSRHNLTSGWSIIFSSSCYFRYSNGEYKRFNYNIMKINVGNCAS